jgi:hypothetical protein
MIAQGKRSVALGTTQKKENARQETRPGVFVSDEIVILINWFQAPRPAVTAESRGGHRLNGGLDGAGAA